MSEVGATTVRFLPNITLLLQCVFMANHWDTKCTNEGCGHRKGNHYLSYGTGLTGLESIGHCHVAYERVNADFVRRKCVCKGFSDGKRWKDGKRI
jgi:hypothetical protein